MNHSDIAAMTKGIAPVVRDYVARAIAPLAQSLRGDAERVAAELRAELRELRAQSAAFPSTDYIAEMKREWSRERELIESQAREVVSDLRARIVEFEAKSERDVAARLATLKDGKDGADGLPGAKGEDADLTPIRAEFAELTNAVSDALGHEVARVGEALANVKDGRDGKDGKDADPVAVAALLIPEVERAVAMIPKAEDGKDADPEAIRDIVADEVAKAVGPTILAPVLSVLVEDTVGKAIADIPVPHDGKDGAPGQDGKDGLGAASALIDRDGNLVMTMTDGSTKSLGVVIGRDGAPGKDGIDGLVGKDGRDGLDGVGFDDMQVSISEDQRTLSIVAERGENRKSWNLPLSHVLDRGVYKEGVEYQKGDAVSYAGSLWIAQQDSKDDKPDSGTGNFRLSVKRGRDGKDGKDGAKGEPGPEGKQGKDLTQIDPTTGRKWS